MPPLDSLPGAMILPTRDDIREQYLRDVRIRTPGAVTIEGTKDYADASVFADQAAAIYFDAKNIGDFVAATNKSGAALDEELLNAGTQRLPAVGGTGSVTITASVGGGTIFAGDEIKDLKTGFRYQCVATALYLTGANVPITGIDTGPTTNLPAGRSLQWTFPRPGIAPNAIIVQQADGSGLSGGRNQETDTEANNRLRARRANPPASGNDADYQAVAQLTPTLSIQQVFTYSCIFGPGSVAITFTIRPGSPGANRIPNPTEIALVRAWLRGKFPADDGIYMSTIVAEPVTLIFQITWAPGAINWADASPWPPYIAGDLINIDNAVAITATSFRLTTATTTTTPQVGQSIAFFDQPNGIFRRKRILTVVVVVADKSWDITVDTTNSVSDISYTPLNDQAPGPWSDSLAGLISSIASYFDTNGPGEQVDPIPDPSLRQARSPRSPSTYASIITNRIISPLFALPTVEDIVLSSPAVPHVTAVGIPGVGVYMHSLGSIVIFPQ